MKSSTKLDSATFQLTPTRTRCDLIISANGKSEKIASGLLNPFLAHLKIAQEQMAKGGYSIVLEPEHRSNRTWFTKGTMERFVRFVSTPEILERVYTIELEILQIEEAIKIQGNNDMGQNVVDEKKGKPTESTEASKSLLDSNEEQAIVLYEPGANPLQANGHTVSGENSKVQLLKVLETRKIMLQKEQGMAFARAVAAGFDIDQMPLLISFADSFGALRLKEACMKFKELWKRKHESGQWLEIEAAEALSSRPDFPSMSTSGIILTSVSDKQTEVRETWPDSQIEPSSTNKGNASTGPSADGSPPLIHPPPPGHQDYLQGQYPHHVYPPWPINSPPGALPVFQAYPMPYYQNYVGNSPFFHPHYPVSEDSRLGDGKKIGHKRHSIDGSDGTNEPESWEMNASKERMHDDEESDKEASEHLRKPGRLGKKKPGMVVIRNINYITSQRHSSSDSGTESASESESMEDGDSEANGPETKHKNSIRSSKSKGKHLKVGDQSGTPAKTVSADSLSGDGRNSGNSHLNEQASELWFMDKKSHLSHSNGRLDPLAINGFDNKNKSSDKSSANNLDDDSYIVPFRSISIDAVRKEDRNAVDMDFEFPSSVQKAENFSNRVATYEVIDHGGIEKAN